MSPQAANTTLPDLDADGSDPLPSLFWRTFEAELTDLGEFLETAKAINAFRVEESSQYVWRGVANSEWALYSSLFRALIEEGEAPGDVTEKKLADREREVVEEARRWNLDWHRDGGRLSTIELLAALQHHGTPTRLLDFSFNCVMALWFAVEKWDEQDGRVVAVDIGDHRVEPDSANASGLSWDDFGEEWSKRTWFWSPPPFEARFVRQQGCFLLGGVPQSRHVGGSYRMDNSDGERVPTMLVSQVRRVLSAAVQFVDIRHATGETIHGSVPTRYPAFTLRIPAASKAEIRRDLLDMFGYSHAAVYPDFTGFRDHGRIRSQRRGIPG